MLGKWLPALHPAVCCILLCCAEVTIAAQGGSFSPTTAFSRICPAGSYITAFNGRSGNVIDAIGPFRCSRGGGNLDMVGGWRGGRGWDHSSYDGYIGISVNAGTLIDQITVFAGGDVVIKGGSGGRAKPRMTCPPGYKLAGVHGTTTTTNPITIGLVCRYF
jgi:hypothetical protein